MAGNAGDMHVKEADCDLGWSIGMLMRHYTAQVKPCTADLPRGMRGYQVLYTVVCKDLPNQLQMAEYLFHQLLPHEPPHDLLNQSMNPKLQTCPPSHQHHRHHDSQWLFPSS